VQSNITFFLFLQFSRNLFPIVRVPQVITIKDFIEIRLQLFEIPPKMSDEESKKLW